MPSLIRDKSGVFFIVYSIKGKRIWRSTKTTDRPKAYQAFLACQSPGQRRTDRKPLSFHIQDYLQHTKATHAHKTYKLYELALHHFLNFAQDVPVESVTARTIDMFKVQRLQETSAATVNINLRAVKAFFNCLKRWDVIAKSPGDGVSQVRMPDQIPPYLTTVQLHDLIEAITDPWIKPIILFAAMTGARLGEILNLTWDRVDMNNRVALIESSVSYQVKGGKMRSIPLNETAYQVLSSFPDRQGLVFKGRRGGRANPNYVSKTFRNIARKTTLDKRLHFHSLRHTFASLLVQNGASLFHVQKLLGHSSSRVTEVYAHLQSPKLHDVVSMISFLPPKIS